MKNGDPEWEEAVAKIEADPKTQTFRNEIERVLSNESIDIDTCKEQLGVIRNAIGDQDYYRVIMHPILRKHDAKFRELLGLPVDK